MFCDLFPKSDCRVDRIGLSSRNEYRSMDNDSVQSDLWVVFAAGKSDLFMKRRSYSTSAGWETL